MVNRNLRRGRHCITLHKDEHQALVDRALELGVYYKDSPNLSGLLQLVGQQELEIVPAEEKPMHLFRVSLVHGDEEVWVWFSQQKEAEEFAIKHFGDPSKVVEEVVPDRTRKQLVRWLNEHEPKPPGFNL